jgi:hypothetical protein
MRIVRLMIAALVGVAVVPLAGALGMPAPASAAGSGTVTVTPAHGVYGAPFTVEYRETAGLLFGGCSAGSVTVTFDGATLGAAPLRQKGGECLATLPTSPPPNQGATSYGRPGAHQVRIAGTSVSTTYTVDPGPSPTVKGPAPASPTATRASPSSRSSTPSTAPTGSASDPPLATGAAGGSPSAGRIVGMPGPNAPGGTSAAPWVLTGGGLLILGDLGLLALLTVRTRRSARRREVTSTSPAPR